MTSLKVVPSAQKMADHRVEVNGRDEAKRGKRARRMLEKKAKEEKEETEARGPDDLDGHRSPDPISKLSVITRERDVDDADVVKSRKPTS